MQKSRINWKVAAVSGALVGVGIGGFAIAGADEPTVLPDGVVLDQSLSVSSPEQAPTTTSIAGDSTGRPTPARADTTSTTIASPASPASVASPQSVASPTSVASPQSVASPASVASPPSPASPASVASPQSVASPASVASPPSPSSPDSPASPAGPASVSSVGSAGSS